MTEQSPNPKTSAVLFDFDGVIVDSFRPAFEVNKMICPHITEDDYRKRFEGNVNDWEEPYHTKDCRTDIDFFAEYIPKMKEVQLFPGMEQVIQELSKLHTLIIISTTITSPIRELLDRFNLAQYFTEIMGNDIHAKKDEKIRMVFTKYGLTPEQCIFVTDTLGDMKEAAKMKVAAIGVNWGFQPEETLAKGSPHRVVAAPKDLPPAIFDYFNSNLLK